MVSRIVNRWDDVNLNEFVELCQSVPHLNVRGGVDVAATDNSLAYQTEEVYSCVEEEERLKLHSVFRSRDQTVAKGCRNRIDVLLQDVQVAWMSGRMCNVDASIHVSSYQLMRDGEQHVPVLHVPLTNEAQVLNLQIVNVTDVGSVLSLAVLEEPNVQCPDVVVHLHMRLIDKVVHQTGRYFSCRSHHATNAQQTGPERQLGPKLHAHQIASDPDLSVGELQTIV